MARPEDTGTHGVMQVEACLSLDRGEVYLPCIYMETTVQKMGEQLAMRVPKALAMQVQIEEGSTVDLVPTKEGLLLKARRRPRYRLSDLVSDVNARNRHAEMDWGKSRGGEVIE